MTYGGVTELRFKTFISLCFRALLVPLYVNATLGSTTALALTIPSLLKTFWTLLVPLPQSDGKS